MGVAFTIGLILSIIVFLLSRRLVKPSYEEGYGSNRVTIPERRLKFPMIMWILYVICTFIPVINIICPIVCLIFMIIGIILEEDFEFRFGKFEKSIINFFGKKL